ncbi:MAG: hypothetical protein M0R02_04485 [Bacteroidales bacterium]|jgi:hypothetical protein|nr:hypothetical protein [Bacteroidales bacterium]NLK81073.1 DUF5320 domain-containing protein [Bacteroidales bacterium]
MANFNRKGPQNEGPMTGRKQGLCKPGNRGLSRDELLQKDQPMGGYGKGRSIRRRRGGSGMGRGENFGMGRGRGSGMGNGRRRIN